MESEERYHYANPTAPLNSHLDWAEAAIITYAPPNKHSLSSWKLPDPQEFVQRLEDVREMDFVKKINKPVWSKATFVRSPRQRRFIY